MGDAILDVDLLAFERGGAAARRATIDGVRTSLASGFVYTSHDIAEGMIDEAYGMLATFFALSEEVKRTYTDPQAHGQTGYTGVLVEQAAGSDEPDWKEMLNWGQQLPAGHPLRSRYPHRYRDPLLPEADVPGITAVLGTFHDQLLELQRRFLRIVALGLGCTERFFDELLRDGPTLSRAIRYPPMTGAPSKAHVWAAAHADINLITALPRASSPGLEVRTADGWVSAVAPSGSVILNAGLMLDRLSNGRIPAAVHRVVAAPGVVEERYSVVQFSHPAPWTILAPLATCIDADTPLRYGPIEAGALLDRTLWEINLLG